MTRGSLVDVVDHLLERGVTLQGDSVVSLAGVDLIYLRLNVLLSSVETLRRQGGWAEQLPDGSGPQLPSGEPPALPVAAPQGSAARRPAFPPSGGADMPAGILEAPGAPLPPLSLDAPIAAAARPGQTVQEGASRSLAQLVITLAEFLRQIVERQALRRVGGGGLDDGQLEKIGLALADLERSMKEMRELFDIEDRDLELDLGPLGQII